MTIRCSKCGNECDELDLFCSFCGSKLYYDAKDSEIEKVKNNKKDLEQTKKTPDLDLIRKAEPKTNRETIDLSYLNGDKAAYTFLASKKKGIMSNFVFNTVIYLLLACSILLYTTFTVLNKQAVHRQFLQYQNMMLNPAQIPELKEPANTQELISNLTEVENFLLMYLRFSKDTTEKKDQIFASFLKEIYKFPHITNEILIDSTQDECALISTKNKAVKCADKYSKTLSSVGILAYPGNNSFYLYPDIKFFKDKYSKYLSNEFRQYLALGARYNKPAGVGLDLYIKPKTLVDKITSFEELYNHISDENIRDWIENVLYEDFRRLIFTPSIYATTTQEMKKEFRSAYMYFINNKKQSLLRPTIMSYYDKQRSYSEQNFRDDYPYKIFDDSFSDTVENSMFSDVFAKLRKDAVSQNEPKEFSYVYNFTDASWSKYINENAVKPNNYILSDIINNNVIIYNNVFAEIQELNLPNFSSLYLINNNLLVYNSSKLQLSKIVYNGRNFTLQNLSSFEISSIFPGIEVIMVDSYSNKNIYLEKDNKKAYYMLLSRYAQGFEEFSIMTSAAEASNAALPNMFGINTLDDVLVTFSKPNTDINDPNSVYYIFKIHTRGQKSNLRQDEGSEFAQFDRQTADTESQNPEHHEANIMPKIENNPPESNDNVLEQAPQQKIEPPKED